LKTGGFVDGYSPRFTIWLKTVALRPVKND
jgi:hypothetical protein